MKKIITGLITLICFVFITLLIYNQVIKIGVNLREHSVYVEYLFYALAILLFYWFIIDPIFTVLFSKYYSVSKYCGKKDTAYAALRLRALKLKKVGNLTESDIVALDEALNNTGENKQERLSQRMNILFSHRIKKNIDKLTLQTATDVFCLTAVSQNNFFDLLTVLVNGLRLIKKIVVMCGFRPTFFRICKLYINVFASALIADGAQKIDVMAMLQVSLNGVLKTITNSAINGSINAFSILRIGMITKNYIYNEDPNKEKHLIRDLAIVDAASMLPMLMANLITSPIKGIASLFVAADKISDNDGEAKNIKEIVENAEWGWKNNNKKDKKD